MTEPRKPLVVPPGEGTFFGPNPGTLKAGGDVTAEAYSFHETTHEPGQATAPHIHLRQEESFYVVSGEVTFRLNEETVLATAGSFVHIPPGTIHGFVNTGTESATLVFVVAPAGLERHFAAIAERRKALQAGEISQEEFNATMKQLSEQNEIVFLPPRQS